MFSIFRSSAERTEKPEESMYFKRLKADLKRYAPYSMEEAKATLRSEISNTYLGWIWWILEPLLQMLVYIFVYGFIFKAKTDCYPAFVFIGVSVWRFFTNTLTASVKLIRNSKSLIVKVYIPKFILVLTKLLTNGLKMLLSFVVLIPILIFYRTPITWYYLLIFPMLLLLFLLTFGVSMLAMHIGVYLDDLANLIPVVLRLMLYFTGIFYSLEEKIPAPYGWLMTHLNPVAFIMDGLRKSVLYGQVFSLPVFCLWIVVSLALCAWSLRILYKFGNQYIKLV